jgi:amicyanin
MEASRPNPGPARTSRRAPRRVAALAVAGAATLGGCSTGASGGLAAPPRTTAAPTTAASATSITGTGGSIAPAPAATANVDIVNFKFTPAAVTVKAGTTLVWTNTDAIAHSVNFTTEAINSAVLNQKNQFSHTFTAPGTYAYICSIHPFMHGTVTVTS